MTWNLKPPLLSLTLSSEKDSPKLPAINEQNSHAKADANPSDQRRLSFISLPTIAYTLLTPTIMIVHRLAAYVLALASMATAVAAVTVDTSFGQVAGTTSNGVDSFLGIQYAAAGKRFARSTLIESQQPLINATSYGPYCYQSIPPGSDQAFSVYTSQPQDEECLHLNIWRPENTTSSSLLTTMVFIHGGGFQLGSGAEPLYTGANLAREHGVVVVTLNYRLGLFGFLVTGENGEGGLNGIHDQINALQWVQNHIESFGGNPNQVTIFGESAGSVSVCMLCVSPLARDLFQRAILQSGECALGILAPNDVQVGAANTALVLNLTSASSVTDLANATRFPAADIAPYSATLSTGWPTVDGWVLPEHPSQLYSNSDKIVPTDMIIGSNSYDSPLVVVISPETYIAMANNSMQGGIIETFGPEYGAAVLEAYSPEKYNGNPIAAYAQYDGDFFFRCASRQFAAIVSDNLVGRVFLYNYAHLSTADPILWNGFQELANINNETWASHGADLPMVFGTFDEFTEGWYMDSVEPSTDDVVLSTEIMARWTSFAKSGDPNTANYVGWNPVSQGENTPGEATTVPTFLLQKGGGEMGDVEEKVKQCSIFAFSSPPPVEKTSSGSLRLRSLKTVTAVLHVLCQTLIHIAC